MAKCYTIKVFKLDKNAPGKIFYCDGCGKEIKVSTEIQLQWDMDACFCSIMCVMNCLKSHHVLKKIKEII